MYSSVCGGIAEDLQYGTLAAALQLICYVAARPGCSLQLARCSTPATHARTHHATHAPCTHARTDRKIGPCKLGKPRVQTKGEP